MARPWTTTNLGWIIAIIVLILALLSLIASINVPLIWLVIGLALAILL